MFVNIPQPLSLPSLLLKMIFLIVFPFLHSESIQISPSQKILPRHMDKVPTTPSVPLHHTAYFANIPFLFIYLIYLFVSLLWKYLPVIRNSVSSSSLKPQNPEKCCMNSKG